jgi:DNA polymerase-3 subunit gamma/tau
MAYQVLARKWRPRNFPEMVGQVHVLRALTNALENQRLHHAYLFTGTRGVGKTTIARILAKSLNCESGVTAYPCGQCSTCREVDEGRFVDLIEVDAASRTKVEDTRELLDNVQYAPTRGRYKVYLIDEVHMLSTHSFNALLKTLEEPPPHVKFLLATTDPQKLPPTILSRCLQFNLKRLPPELIAEHLQKILVSENIHHEFKALQLLAQAADGSLRDALSLLDQAIAYGGNRLLVDDVENMLGTIDPHAVWEMVKALANRDAPSLLQRIAQLAESNPDYSTVLGDVLSVLQKIALAQIIPSTVQADQPEGEWVLQLAKQLSPEDVQLFYQIGLLGRRDLPLAPEPRGGFEMVMLRMLAFLPENMTLTASVVKSPAVATQSMPIIKATPLIEVPTALVNVAKEQAVVSLNDWLQVVQALNLSGFAKELARNCELKRCEQDVWHLVLPQPKKIWFTEDRRKSLESALQRHCGKPQQVYITIEQTPNGMLINQPQRVQESHEQYLVLLKEELNSDPMVCYFKERCGAKVSVVAQE